MLSRTRTYAERTSSHPRGQRSSRSICSLLPPLSCAPIVAARRGAAAAGPRRPSPAVSTRSPTTCRCCRWPWPSGAGCCCVGALPLAPHRAAARRGMGDRPRLPERRDALHPRRSTSAGWTSSCWATTGSAASGCCSSPSSPASSCSPRSWPCALTSRYVRSHGFNYRTVLIVGTSAAALRIADSIHGHRFWGFRILGFIRQRGRTRRQRDVLAPSRYPVLGEIERHPADRREQRGGRRHLRRPPPRAGPPGGPVPEPPGAGHPHPLRDGPLPAHPRPGGAGGAGRHARC